MQTLLVLFIILAAFALLWWGVGQLPLPPVVRTVIIVIMGFVALLFLYNLVVGGTFSFGG